MDARLVLLITGKARPVDAADRGTRRGAIRAKVLDWLAAGPHAGDIAAIRAAHRRHGGEGALYLVLRRRLSPPRACPGRGPPAKRVVEGHPPSAGFAVCHLPRQARGGLVHAASAISSAGALRMM